MWTDIDLEYWLRQASVELRQKALQDALVDTVSERRLRAAEYAGRLMMIDMVPALQKLIDEDSSPAVLREAACSLARMDAPRFITYVQEMLRGSPDHQQRALEALDGIQVAAPDLPNMDLLERPILRWRLRRFRVKRNRAQRNQIVSHAAIGGAFGAALGGTLGAIFSWPNIPVELKPQFLPLVFMLSLIIGLAIGMGAGFGYGMVRAMNERHMFVYINGAILGGGLGGLLVGIIGDMSSLNMALLGGAVGMFGGVTSGGGAATAIYMTTAIISPARRMISRLALGLLVGVIPGLVFVLGAKLQTLPVQGLPYGLGLGALMTSGIAIGLELAERALGRTHQAGANIPADKVDIFSLEGKGG